MGCVVVCVLVAVLAFMQRALLLMLQHSAGASRPGP
jgi:hypothetical protein